MSRRPPSSPRGRAARSARRVGRKARAATKLSPRYWAALARAAVWIVGTRTALAFVPWSRVSATFDAVPFGRDEPDWGRARVSLWAVRAVSKRLLRGRPCLTQALVARRLLRRDGVDAELRLGATRGGGGAFEAHAWLEHEGRVLIGGSDSLGKYVPFRGLGSAGRPPRETVWDEGWEG